MTKVILPDEEIASFQSVSDFKERLRKQILAKRSELSSQTKSLLSEQISEHVLMIDEVNNAKTIALYASRAGEPETDLLLKILTMRGKNVLLPVLGDGLQRGWAKFTALSDLSVRISGRPPEPSSPNLGEDAAKEIDLFLMPALAVCKNGARLGHGGGWYDRVLKIAKTNTKFFSIVYSDEIYDENDNFPLEDHDVLIHAAISEKGFCRFNNNKI